MDQIILISQYRVFPQGLSHTTISNKDTKKSPFVTCVSCNRLSNYSTVNLLASGWDALCFWRFDCMIQVAVRIRDCQGRARHASWTSCSKWTASCVSYQCSIRQSPAMWQPEVTMGSCIPHVCHLKNQLYFKEIKILHAFDWEWRNSWPVCVQSSETYANPLKPSWLTQCIVFI